jgi:hypothetical protein
MCVLTKLRDALDELEYGYSDLNTVLNDMPDWDSISEYKSELSNAESYLLNCKELLESVIVALDNITDELGN